MDGGDAGCQDFSDAQNKSKNISGGSGSDSDSSEQLIIVDYQTSLAAPKEKMEQTSGGGGLHYASNAAVIENIIDYQEEAELPDYEEADDIGGLGDGGGYISDFNQKKSFTPHKSAKVAEPLDPVPIHSPPPANQHYYSHNLAAAAAPHQTDFRRQTSQENRFVGSGSGAANNSSAPPQKSHQPPWIFEKIKDCFYAMAYLIKSIGSAIHTLIAYRASPPARMFGSGKRATTATGGFFLFAIILQAFITVALFSSFVYIGNSSGESSSTSDGGDNKPAAAVTAADHAHINWIWLLSPQAVFITPLGMYLFLYGGRIMRASKQARGLITLYMFAEVAMLGVAIYLLARYSRLLWKEGHWNEMVKAHLVTSELALLSSNQAASGGDDISQTAAASCVAESNHQAVHRTIVFFIILLSFFILLTIGIIATLTKKTIDINNGDSGGGFEHYDSDEADCGDSGGYIDKDLESGSGGAMRNRQHTASSGIYQSQTNSAAGSFNNNGAAAAAGGVNYANMDMDTMCSLFRQSNKPRRFDAAALSNHHSMNPNSYYNKFAPPHVINNSGGARF